MTLAERARIMARRQELHREKHPDQKLGSPGAKARWNAGEIVSPAFTSEVAAITGKVERVVQLDISRGTKIGEQALTLVTRTPLDNARYLDTLKHVTKDEQVARVQHDLANPPERPPSQSDPDAAGREAQAPQQLRRAVYFPPCAPASSGWGKHDEHAGRFRHVCCRTARPNRCGSYASACPCNHGYRTWSAFRRRSGYAKAGCRGRRAKLPLLPRQPASRHSA